MKILVGISGGVDSAFAAKMLKERGDDVTCCILKMHEFSDTLGARKVADELGLELVEIDCTKRFDNTIKSYFVREYMRGRTPNPCIVCNERVKFAALYEYATENGFDRIATGHYAKIVEDRTSGKLAHYLCRAADLTKDQSYMLYRLPEEILAKTEFPLGELTKEEVRRCSEIYGLSVAGAADSQEICFLPDGGYSEYIESVAGKSPEGNFVDTEGNVLGKHNGIVRYTVGQRKGLGISLGKRMFVSQIDPIENTVTLSETLEGREEVILSETVISGGADPRLMSGGKYWAKLRYSSPLVGAYVEIFDGSKARLNLVSATKGAPGQSAVVYDGEGRVVLGGFIEP